MSVTTSSWSLPLALGLAVVAAAPAPAHAQDPKFAYATPEERAAAEAAKEPEWKASAQAGLLVTTGNSRITTLSAGATTSWKKDKNKLSFEGTAAYARSSIFLAVDEDASGFIEEDEVTRPAQTTTRMWGVKGRYDRFLTDNNALYGIAGASGDRPAGKELVGNAQAGYSRQLFKSDDHLVVAEGGYDFTYEDLVVGEGTSIHSLRGFAGYAGKLTADTGLEGSVEGLFNLNSLDLGDRQIDSFEDARINSKVALTTTLFSDISFRFSFEAKFDNAPAPRPPFAIPYAAGFQPLADELDTKTEAVLIVNFL
jgi:putative salt-induced outer membrane protein YdiY